jgi:DNA-binding CsgD family transcriptional regulator
MAHKIGISKSEMLRMREQGLSNRDIAKCLDIHFATVYNYIGPQGGAHGESSSL